MSRHSKPTMSVEFDDILLRQDLDADAIKAEGVEGAVILNNVAGNKNVNYGYDAANDAYGDMIKLGIVDPTKVCRSALENAASVASMVLTTESLVADIPEKNPPMPAAPDMGGMY